MATPRGQRVELDECGLARLAAIVDERDDLLEVRREAVGSVDIDRGRSKRQTLERRIRSPPVLDLVADDPRVSRRPGRVGRHTATFASDGGVGVALDDP